MLLADPICPVSGLAPADSRAQIAPAAVKGNAHQSPCATQRRRRLFPRTEDHFPCAGTGPRPGPARQRHSRELIHAAGGYAACVVSLAPALARTVSTGHDAFRSTRSATLPITA